VPSVVDRVGGPGGPRGEDEGAARPGPGPRRLGPRPGPAPRNFEVGRRGEQALPEEPVTDSVVSARSSPPPPSAAAP